MSRWIAEKVGKRWAVVCCWPLRLVLENDAGNVKLFRSRGAADQAAKEFS